ncbi:MAG: hypothetical protein JEZ04_16950 [Spirochaetales bacterium]|nr:hypothetical protein [Spirochaetales bacterium]
MIRFKENPAYIRTTVIKAVQMQLELYPQSSLKDIYKSFFQDEFGPGHLLVNPEKARSFFEQELETMKSRGRCNTEPCGRGRNFYRVPMDLVLDKVVRADDYFSAFWASASKSMVSDEDEWKKKWNIIFRILQRHSDIIKNFKKDSKEILEALENGNYVMHHSTRYREVYAPHYRIFRTSPATYKGLIV